MSVRQLHITNGDSAANIIKASSVEGDVLPWRDPMHHGPFPAETGLDALADIRSTFLAGSAYDVDEIRRDFRLRNDHLRAFQRYDEVILWFEHDLLDQLQILELLSWFSNTDIGSSSLAIICIIEFPGMADFRGIGELNAVQMASLLPTRVPVTAEQLQLAGTAWACFRADDPLRLEALTRTDTAALPFLGAAVRRLFEEYPWVRDGLTRTERQLLQVIASGSISPGAVFVENMNLETALYLGDSPTFRVIARLCALQTPLLACAPDGAFRYPPADDITPDRFQQQSLTLTDAGRAVLAGAQHASSLIRRDEWLGGVHLNSDMSMWL